MSASTPAVASPTLSVCMASYNGSAYLRAQIDSILGQLGPDDELLVSDDASTDDTLAILRSYGKRIRIVGTDRSGGVVANFERVMCHATKDVIALSDQDDVWLDGRVDLIRASLRDCDLVMLNGIVVDGALQSLDTTVFRSVGVRGGFWRNLAKNSFVGCCMAFRRDLVQSALPFPHGLPWHDWLIGLLAELRGGVRRVETPTILYRRHGANFSPTGEKSTFSIAHRLAMRVAVLRAIAQILLRRSNHRMA